MRVVVRTRVSTLGSRRELGPATCAVLILASGCSMGVRLTGEEERTDGEAGVGDGAYGDDVADRADTGDADDLAADRAGSVCGNGVLEPGEGCDGDPARACATACVSSGTRACVDCAWATRCDPSPGITIPAGIVVGGPVSVAEAPGVHPRLSLVWTGSEYAVAWTGQGEWRRQVFFARISELGLGIGPATIVSDEAVTISPGAQVLAWTGAEYGVIWSDRRWTSRELFFARLDRSGAKIGFDIYLTARGYPAALLAGFASGASGYGVLWCAGDEGECRDGNGFFAALLPDGAWAGPEIEFPTGEARSSWGPTTLVPVGEAYSASWVVNLGSLDEVSEILFAQFRPSEGVVDGPRTAVSGPTYPGRMDNPSLAANGGGFGLLWSEATGEDPRHESLRFLALSAAGEPLLPTTVLSDDGANRVEPSALAWTGDEYAVTWTDRAAERDRIRFMRFDRAGTLLGAPSSVAEFSSTYPGGYPEMAAAADEYGIAWASGSSEPGAVYFARVAPCR